MSFYPSSFGGYFYKISDYYLSDINGVGAKDASVDQMLTYKSGLWQPYTLRPIPTDNRVFTKYYYTTVTTAADTTYTNVVNAIIDRDCSGANRADTFPTYTTIKAELEAKGLPTFSGYAFMFYIRNSSGPGETISSVSANTGVTVYGRTYVPSGYCMRCRVVMGTSDLTIAIAGLGQYT